MRSVTQADFEQMIAGAKVLERQEGGLSALRSADGHIIKIWQRRGGLSSDRLRPYSKRFADNCARLNERAIPAPVVSDSFRIKETGEHVLIYPMLPGHSMADLAAADGLPIEAMAQFYVQLHNAGVFFRSIHLGNVLQLEDQRLGVIDVTDCWFYKSPLGMKKRAQNIGYAWAYRGDNVYFTDAVRERMQAVYLDKAELSAKQQQQFKQHLAEAYAHYSARKARRVDAS